MILFSRAVSFWKSFSRAQVASAIATALDFGMLLLFVEYFGIRYVPATALAAFGGAISNFLLNRRWSFEATSGSWNAQAWRYALVSGGALLLNSGGVYAFTEWTGVHYLSSKVAMSFFVGIFFNFPLHRYFVFRQENRESAAVSSLSPDFGGATFVPATTPDTPAMKLRLQRRR